VSHLLIWEATEVNLVLSASHSDSIRAEQILLVIGKLVASRMDHQRNGRTECRGFCSRMSLCIVRIPRQRLAMGLNCTDDQGTDS